MKNKMVVNVESSETVYDGFFKMLKYRLRHSLFGGGLSEPFTREIFVRPNAVAVLMHDPVLEEVVLIRQFRIGAVDSENPWLEELVAGVIELGEIPEEVARREATEETGVCLTKPLCKIGKYYGSAGGSNEMTTLYYTVVDASTASGIHGLENENEDILVVRKKVSELFSEIDNSLIDTASLLIAALWLRGHISN